MAASSIIAVPGLSAHATGSFRSNDGEQVWLCDFLPSDIPNCRVMVYGYDSRMDKADGTSSVSDRAATFLGLLHNFREGTEVRKKESFIMYYFGYFGG